MRHRRSPEEGPVTATPRKPTDTAPVSYPTTDLWEPGGAIPSGHPTISWCIRPPLHRL